MKYLRYQPSPSLHKFVQFFWSFETDSDTDLPFEHWSVASGASKIIFQYNGSMTSHEQTGKIETVPAATIQSQTRTAFRFISSGPVGILGVYFYPGALPLLFSLPANELTNQITSLSTLTGGIGNELEERVMLASSNLERI